jgi:hypothetical protein
MENFDYTKIELNTTKVPEGAVSDEYVYAIQHGDNITVGNRTSNCWVNITIPRPNTQINYYGGGLRHTEINKVIPIKHLSFRHRNNQLIIKYTLRVNKTKIESEIRTLVLIIK